MTDVEGPSPEPLGSGDETDRESSQWRWVAAGVVGVVIILIIVIAAVTSGGSDSTDEKADGSGRGTTTTSVPSTASTASSDTPDDPVATTTVPDVIVPSDPGGSTDGDTSGLPVPIGPVPGVGEVEICAGVQDRLKIYRTVAVKTDPGQLGAINDALREFSDEIFTLAEDQDWGDRIIVELTGVRREWATAMSAAENDDTKEANSRSESALKFLDAALAVDCPIG